MRAPGPLLLALVLLLAVTPSASAAEPSLWAPREWAFGAGVFDFTNSERAEVNVEARFQPLGLGFRLFANDVVVEPGVGALVNEDGGYYGYTSLRFPLHFGDRWRVTPYTGAGIYSAGGGKDLGGPVEFRSGLEIAARVGRRSYLGVNYYHLSNAVLYDDNPGTESLILTYSIRP